LDWPDSRVSRLRRFIVLSPHLDDAALSLGGTIARATAKGAEVTVVTVFGGDSQDQRPAGDWDRKCGYATAGEAARSRRLEEARACRALRAKGLPLPFADEQYATDRDEVKIWNALAPLLDGAEVVLLPGWPLIHRDHRWLSHLVRQRLPPEVPIGLYIDQPYAVWETVGSSRVASRLLHRVQQAVRSPAAAERQRPRDVDGTTAGLYGRWEVASLGTSAQLAKWRAMRSYESQLRGFGSLFLTQIMLYAWADGGEPIGWTPAE
jgi:LmbE family N-acetylglucosaminyl deacetylase